MAVEMQTVNSDSGNEEIKQMKHKPQAFIHSENSLLEKDVSTGQQAEELGTMKTDVLEK